MLRKLIQTRFGCLPDWAEARLAALPISALEALSERLQDTASLEELLK